MIRTLLTLMFIISGYVNANDSICPKVTSSGEGNWPIPETEFTKEAAQSATNRLKNFIESGTKGADFVVVENEVLIIKGYLLKSRVGNNILHSKDDFCNFIKNDAYLQH